jgi:hypothetical protein
MLVLAVNVPFSFHEQREQTKGANIMSGMVKNLSRKKFLPTHIGVIFPSICQRDFV